MKEKTEEDQETESRLLLAVETGSLSAIRPIVLTICAELVSAGSDELRIKETFVRLLSTVLARLEPTYRKFAPMQQSIPSNRGALSKLLFV